MSRPPWPRRALLPVALTLLTLASACSGSDDPSVHGAAPTSTERVSSPSSSSSTATTTVPPSTIAAPPTTAPFDAAALAALRPPAPAGDPVGLAAQIVAAETTVRDGTASDATVAQAALAMQVAYRQLGVHPEWDPAVLAAVPAALHPAVTRQAAARREFGAMHHSLAPAPPAWRIEAPAPLAQLRDDYVAAGAAFGIPWQYLAAVNLVETGTGRIRATSVAGAQGPMQFLPSTWARYGAGGNIEDPHDAIFGAARYLAANGGATDLRKALWHYNHSDHYVLGVLLYGDLIAEHPLALRAFYDWGVWYKTAGGDVYLPIGYGQ